MARRAELDAAKDLPILQDMLGLKIQQSAEAAETIGEKTIAAEGGKIKIKSYLEARKVHHRLAAKADKLREIRGQ